MFDDDIKTTVSEFEDLDEIEARLKPMILNLTEENSQIIYDEVDAMLKGVIDVVDDCESVDEVVEIYGILAPYFFLVRRIARKVKLVEDQITIRTGKLALKKD